MAKYQEFKYEAKVSVNDCDYLHIDGMREQVNSTFTFKEGIEFIEAEMLAYVKEYIFEEDDDEVSYIEIYNIEYVRDTDTYGEETN